MNKQPDSLREHLKVLRNLCASAYGKLANGGSLRQELLDQEVSQRLNGLVFNVKRRFDSYKVLLQSIQPGTTSDGSIALAQSMFTYVYMIRELLEVAGIGERARPYKSVCEPMIADLFPESELAQSPPSEELVKRSIRLPHQLNAIAPASVAYWFVICLAETYARSINLTHAGSFAKIVREITFPPEYQQAGLSILNYFATVLADKYPNIPVAVSIKQEPNLVTLVITLPDGSQDTVTKVLNDYGLVVTGKMSPRDLVSNDIQALALQQKLELAQMEVRQTRDLLRIQEQYANKRVESIESEVRKLYSLLERELTSRERLQEGLMNLTGQLANGHVSEHTIHLITALSEAISERNEEKTRVVLEDIQSIEPDLFSRLHNFFVEATTSGVIGNAVYDWLKVVWPILPK